MSIDFTTILPPELNRPDQKTAVAWFLVRLPLNGSDLAAAYADWARQVGVQLTYEELQSVGKLRRKVQATP